MPRKRYIHTIPKTYRIIDLFVGLGNAFKDKQSFDPPSNTDLIGYALQYLGRKWKREDYEEILDMKVSEIIEMVEKYNWNLCPVQKPEVGQRISMLDKAGYLYEDVLVEEGDDEVIDWWKPFEE